MSFSPRAPRTLKGGLVLMDADGKALLRTVAFQYNPDSLSRTLQARIVTQNPRKKLKKDMYVTATVRAAAVQNVLTVPDDAILRDTENEPFVYVQSAPTEFSRRQVTLGESGHGRVQLKTGAKEGERVAGNGSLFLQFMNSLQH